MSPNHRYEPLQAKRDFLKMKRWINDQPHVIQSSPTAPNAAPGASELHHLLPTVVVDNREAEVVKKRFRGGGTADTVDSTTTTPPPNGNNNYNAITTTDSFPPKGGGTTNNKKVVSFSCEDSVVDMEMLPPEHNSDSSPVVGDMAQRDELALLEYDSTTANNGGECGEATTPSYSLKLLSMISASSPRSGSLHLPGRLVALSHSGLSYEECEEFGGDETLRNSQLLERQQQQQCNNEVMRLVALADDDDDDTTDETMTPLMTDERLRLPGIPNRREALLMLMTDPRLKEEAIRESKRLVEDMANWVAQRVAFSDAIAIFEYERFPWDEFMDDEDGQQQHMTIEHGKSGEENISEDGSDDAVMIPADPDLTFIPTIPNRRLVRGENVSRDLQKYNALKKMSPRACAGDITGRNRLSAPASFLSDENDSLIIYQKTSNRADKLAPDGIVQNFTSSPSAMTTPPSHSPYSHSSAVPFCGIPSVASKVAASSTHVNGAEEPTIVTPSSSFIR